MQSIHPHQPTRPHLPAQATPPVRSGRPVRPGVFGRAGQPGGDRPRMRGGEEPSGVGGFEGQIFERLLRERIIFLGREVDDAIANTICAQMLLLAADDPERDIVLYINSPGGSVSAGMAVYDTMHFISNDVSTVALGMTASMGQFLLCAGTAGKRYALPHARIMMHQVSGGIGGTSADIAIQAQSMLHVRRTQLELTAKHTGQTPEQIAADWDRDRWFTAEQARDYGMVDHIITTPAQLTPTP